WSWKDELPERGLACVGKHLGRWAALIAPRLLPAVYVVAADRRDGLTEFQFEVAEAVRAGGPCTGPELRALVGADKKQTDAAVIVLQRALVLTNSGLVEQEQGWGAIAVDVLTRKWKLGRLPRADAAERTLAATVLGSSGELSAADLGGALGWRLKRSRETLEELVERGEAVVTTAATMSAPILVEPSGENRIVIVPGALEHLSPAHVDAFADRIAAADVCVVQLEIPVATALYALAVARREGVRTILN